MMRVMKREQKVAVLVGSEHDGQISRSNSDSLLEFIHGNY